MTSPAPELCQHETTVAEFTMFRLTAGDDPTSPTIAFTATLTAQCAGCGHPFVFCRGDIPVGWAVDGLSVSFDLA